MNFSFGALLVAVVLGWIACTSIVISLHGSDAAGNAMSAAFGTLASIAVWIVLAAMMTMATLQAGVPAWVRASAALLFAACAAANFAAIHLASNSFYRSRWPVVVPAVAPLLLVALALWMRLPALQRDWPKAPVPLLAGLAVLAVLPWPAVRYRSQNQWRDIERAAEARRVDDIRAQAEGKARDLAKFDKLTADSPLEEWLAFADPENELHARAWEGIRKLPRRQADVERMLHAQRDWIVQDLAKFDLEATPAVCDGARERLRKLAREMLRYKGTGPVYFHAQSEALAYQGAMAWMVEHGCACGPELEELERQVQIFEDSPERQQFLKFLAGLRRKL